MNLWIRFLYVIVRAWLGRRAGLFDTTALRLTVLPNDLDVNAHINNGRWLTLADLGRLDYIVRTGSARVAIKRRARPIVGDAAAKFRRGLRAFERYEIRTRLLGWDEKWTFMEHRFVRRGRVAGVVVMRGVFQAQDGLMTPAEFARAFGVPERSPPLPAWVESWSRSCDALSVDLRAEEVALAA